MKEINERNCWDEAFTVEGITVDESELKRPIGFDRQLITIFHKIQDIHEKNVEKM